MKHIAPRPTPRALALVVLMATFSAPSPAIARTFDHGDLYLVSRALPDPANPTGSLSGVMHIDPLTGNTTALFDDSAQRGFATYDPFRDRLVVTFNAGVLEAMDSTGAMTDLGVAWGPLQVRQVAARGDGLLYMVSSGGDFGFLDAADATHDLLDEAGTGPFDFVSRALIYDAITNSLFTADDIGLGETRIHRIPLTSDGTQVAGPLQTVTYDVSPTSDDHPVGFSRGPGGLLLLKVDDNTNLTLPRMLTVDPVTLAVVPYASSGYIGVGAEKAGAYHAGRDETVVLDTRNDVLRTYGAGETGPGTVLAGGVSADTGNGEEAQFVVVGGTINTHAADTGFDGAVNVDDLLAVLAAWGPCPGCPEDITHDGVVDVADLLLVLAGWTN